MLISWQQWRWPCCLAMSNRCQEVTLVSKCALCRFSSAPELCQLRAVHRDGACLRKESHRQHRKALTQPGLVSCSKEVSPSRETWQGMKHLPISASKKAERPGSLCKKNADRDISQVLSGPSPIKSCLKWWLQCSRNLQELKTTFLLKIFQKYGMSMDAHHLWTKCSKPLARIKIKCTWLGKRSPGEKIYGYKRGCSGSYGGTYW